MTFKAAGLAADRSAPIGRPRRSAYHEDADADAAPLDAVAWSGLRSAAPQGLWAGGIPSNSRDAFFRNGDGCQQGSSPTYRQGHRRTSANHVRLAVGGPLFVGADERGFSIRWQLPGNQLATRIRIPGPSAQNSDPALTVPFDLEMNIEVDLTGVQLHARSATIKVKAHRPYGRNTTGKLAIAAADLIKTIGGPDFVGTLVGRFNSREYAVADFINQELANVNQRLAPFANVATVRPGLDTARRSILLTVEKK